MQLFPGPGHTAAGTRQPADSRPVDPAARHFCPGSSSMDVPMHMD